MHLWHIVTYTHSLTPHPVQLDDRASVVCMAFLSLMLVMYSLYCAISHVTYNILVAAAEFRIAMAVRQLCYGIACCTCSGL